MVEKINWNGEGGGMTISCSCDMEDGVRTVGDPRDVTCRTPRKCDCGRQISTGDPMYIWSMYDWDEMRTSSPYYLCEECGDMSLNLMKVGYCFTMGESIRDQWLEYLYDTGQDNPAVRSMRCA